MIELIQTPTQTIFVDIVGTFGAEAKAEQTKTPVEDGSLRSDHKVILPATLSVEVQQTEHPIDDPDYEMQRLSLSIPKAAVVPEPLRVEVEPVRTTVTSPFLLAENVVGVAANAIGSLVGGGALGGIELIASTVRFVDAFESTEGYQTNTPRDRGGELADKFAELFGGDEVATVTYRGRTYQNMSLIGVSLGYTPGLAGLTTFNLAFEELKTATVARVALVDPEILAAKAQAALGKKKGAEGAKDAGVNAGKGKSILAGLID